MPGKEGSLPASTLRLYRNTPLHVACMYGSLATIELLSQMQPLVDVSARNAAGMTPAECVGPPWRNNGSVEPTEEERDRMLALLQPRWWGFVATPVSFFASPLLFFSLTFPCLPCLTTLARAFLSFHFAP